MNHIELQFEGLSEQEKKELKEAYKQIDKLVSVIDKAIKKTGIERPGIVIEAIAIYIADSITNSFNTTEEQHKYIDFIISRILTLCESFQNQMKEYYRKRIINLKPDDE